MRTPCGYDNMSPTTGNIPKANGMFRGVGACCIDDMVIDRSIGHRSRVERWQSLAENNNEILDQRYAGLKNHEGV